VVVLATPTGLLAQGVPLGPEFRVNTYITFQQEGGDVAFDPAGNFVIVWTDWSAHAGGNGADVLGQRYASSGASLGGEFRINSYTTGNQFLGPRSSVSCDSTGNFVVVWNSYNQDGSIFGVYAQRIASTGAPLGGEFRVNTTTIGFQFLPSVASDSVGNFIVVWGSNAVGSDPDVFGQRYTSTGVPLGGEFRINTYTTGSQGGPTVARAASGHFVVVWTSVHDGYGTGVFAQRYDNSGLPLGPEFRVNSFTPFFQEGPAIAADPAGNFVIAWTSLNQEGSGQGVFAQRFASTGPAMGGEFRVNTFTTSYQREPSAASDSAGNFVIAWMSYGQDGSDYGVFAQRYSNTGAPVGSEFRVNSYRTNTQYFPEVAADPLGTFVIVWTSYTQDGSLQGVYAQRYSMIVPVELQDFRLE